MYRGQGRWGRGSELWREVGEGGKVNLVTCVDEIQLKKLLRALLVNDWLNWHMYMCMSI